MGIWEVRIEHRRKYRSRHCCAIAFLMNDKDAETMLFTAFEKAVRALKKEVNNKKGA